MKKQYKSKSYKNTSKQQIPNTESAKDEGLIRLNKFIANAGVCSRREADTLIQNGEITVNNKPISELGYKVHPNDKVKYKGKLLKPEKLIYVLLNKPKDFITTTNDPQNRKTVMQLVSKATSERIYPVGRLDRNTTGLLLLTNDGDLAKKLSHPSHMIKKLYEVEINKPISEESFHSIVEGITLEDGPVQIDEIAIINEKRTKLGIEIHIGRNRIVRRIFEHLGYEVTKLDRVIYAGLTKKDLPRGKWRYLAAKEIIQLKYLHG